MPSFAYKGRNAEGVLVQGVLESADINSLADRLAADGVTPLDITATGVAAAASEAKPTPNAFNKFFEEKVQHADILLFSRQMYTLLKSGIPIMRALSGLQESASNKAFAMVLKEVREGLDSGRELSAALALQPKVFSPFYVNMVRVGEMTGLMDEIFLRLYYHMEFEKFITEQTKAAIRYPSFVIIAMIIAIVVINIFVIPAFAKVYKGLNAKLPFLTQVLITLSDFTVKFWPLLLLISIGGFFGFRYYTRMPKGRLWWDRIKLRFPIAGKIILKAALARFTRSFALTMRSRVPVIQGLSMVIHVIDNDYIAYRVEQMRQNVERGDSILRSAVGTGVFTPVVLQMIAVGEESGGLDDLMQEIAEMYQREIEYELKTLSAQIEPILIIFLGALVLVLALGVFLPIWDIGKVAVK